MLRIDLAPAAAPGHVLGWRIVQSDSDVLHLAASSPLLGDAAIIERRVTPNRGRISTYLFFRRPRAARATWAVVGPLHRLVAPYLIERSAAS